MTPRPTRLAIAPPLLLTLVSLAACPPGKPRTISERDVSRAGSAPQISSIVDLGKRDIIRDAPFELTGGDGHGVIGEVLLIKGSNFGKQPTTTIGDQPATFIGHVSTGGILVRVPWGIDAGKIKVEVANHSGRSSTTYPIKRVVVATDGAHAHLLDLDGKARLQKRGERIDIAGASVVGVSTSGGTAFVAGAKAKVSFIALPSGKVVREKQMSGKRVVAITTASDKPLSAVVTDTHVTFLDERKPSRVALYTAQRLPKQVVDGKPVSAALSPDGKRLAILLAEGNKLAIFDASKPQALPAPTIIDALPEARLSVGVGVRFSANSKTAWVLGGDTARSISGGRQPTRVATIKTAAKPPSVGDPRGITPPGAPLSVCVARGEPTPPGTSIRRAPASRSALYAALAPPELLAEKKIAGKGRVVRAEPGKAFTLVDSGDWLLAGIDVAGKTQIIVGVGVRTTAKGPGGRIAWARAAWREDAKAQIVEMGAAGKDPLAGDIRAQP